ncbi:MAG: hypothetical protein V3T48_01610 [Vicinamibacterales bacterium]
MKRIRRTLIGLLLSALVVNPVLAQQLHVVDQVALDQQVAAKVAKTAEQRAVIERLLEREEVRSVAERTGIELADVKAAVATLEGDELAQLAVHAQGVDDSLTGGQSTITISTTTIIIGLLVVILLVVVT